MLITFVVNIGTHRGGGGEAAAPLWGAAEGRPLFYYESYQQVVKKSSLGLQEYFLRTLRRRFNAVERVQRVQRVQRINQAGICVPGAEL